MAYSYYASITIDNTKVVGSANHSDMPILVSGTYDGTGSEPDLRTSANGGNIENTASGGSSGSYTVPADLAFYDDTSATTQYAHEVVEYSASTGLFKAYVKIPTVDYNDDTVFYMHYGDSGVSTSQEDLSTLWTDYQAVYHLNESSGTRYDATSNSNDTSSEVNTDAGTGNLYTNCASWDADGRMEVADANSLDITSGTITITGWFYDKGGSGWCTLFVKGNDAGLDPANYWVRKDQVQDISLAHYDASNNLHYYNTSSTGNYSTNTWVHVSHRYTLGTGSSANIRLDKSNVAASWIVNNGNTAPPANSQKLFFADSNGGDATKLDGMMQEWRIRFSSLSNDWTDTEYNNQNSPSTFYTMGDETEASAGGGIAASRRSIVY